MHVPLTDTKYEKLQRIPTLCSNDSKISPPVSPQVYKNIQRIKKQRMNSLGLKGTQVMCIYYLSIHPEGMTAADLSRITVEDKASISRILAELEEEGYITYETEPGRKYRLPPFSQKKAGKSGENSAADSSGHGSRAQGLTDEEREIFYRALFQIADNLSALLTNLSK